jgi:hypothetical protein
MTRLSQAWEAERCSANLFICLGKYVRRQDENLLTQALAALFNNSGRFRSDLLHRLGGDAGVSTVAVTQPSRKLKDGRIIVDLEIRKPKTEHPEFVLEAKVNAPLTEWQLKRYAEFLKKRRGKSRLVIVTASGIDSELKGLLPESHTTWLTWAEIAEMAIRPAHRSKVERMLCEQFYQFLQYRGIPMAPSISAGAFRKLSIFNRLVHGERDSLHEGGIHAVETVAVRLQVFAETAWAPLARGMNQFDRIYSYRDAGSVEICSGFYRSYPTRSAVAERYISIGVDCSDLRMFVYGGWKLRRNHEEYRSEDRGEYLKRWTKPQTQSFFTSPLADANGHTLTRELVKQFKGFERSPYGSGR